MYYIKNKIYVYPNKSIVQDVLSRTGPVDQYSFTPYDGMMHIVREQFPTSNGQLVVSIPEIVGSGIDFSAEKVKPNDDGVEREDRACEVKDYYTDLEDISEEWIERYIKNLCVAYKMNNKGRKKDEWEMRVSQCFYDEEEDEFVDINDVLAQEREFTTSEIVEAQLKLPYVLKQLHDGSIKYGGSLLSFVIALERCRKGAIATKDTKIGPADIIDKQVYRMSNTGIIGAPFERKDNTVDPLRSLIKWVFGNDTEDKIYYKAAQELLRICAVLDVDLAKEDARTYTSDYISKLVCKYLVSNEEYMETYGCFVDRKIMRSLKPDRLFSVVKELAEDEVDEEEITMSVIADNIAAAAESFKFSRPKLWEGKPVLVNTYLNVAGITDTKGRAVTVDRLDVEKTILKNFDGTYVCVDVSKLIGTRRAALISISGYLILLEPIKDFDLRVIRMEEAIKVLKAGGGQFCAIETLRV